MPSGRRPVVDEACTPISVEERRILSDFMQLMRDVIAECEVLRDPRTGAGGHFLTSREIELTREDREARLLQIERAIMPLANAARPPLSKGARLFELLRRDVHPTGPLPPGAYARHADVRWVESVEDLWERTVIWSLRLLDGSHDRAIALDEITIALDHLAGFGVLARSLPEQHVIAHAILPRTTRKRQRTRTYVAKSLSSLTGVAVKTITRAVATSDKRAMKHGDTDGRTVEQERLHRRLRGEHEAERQERKRRELEMTRIRSASSTAGDESLG
jgi:hypothetical protein